MKALYFEEVGTPEKVLKYGEIPQPQCLEGQLVIKIEACTVNPADRMFINGAYRRKPLFPQIAGFDATGTVVEVDGKTQTPVGTRVYFRHPGVWAERVAVPEAITHHLPDQISFEAGTQLALNLPTAWALMELVRDRVEESSEGFLAVTASQSAIARVLLALARTRGYQTLGFVRESTTSVGNLEATHVITYSQPDEIIEKVKRIRPAPKVVACLDPVGGALATQMVHLMESHGELVIYGLLDPGPIDLTARDYVSRLVRISGFGIDGWLARTPIDIQKKLRQQMHASLIRQPEMVSLNPPITFKTFLDEVWRDPQFFSRGPNKIVLKP